MTDNKPNSSATIASQSTAIASQSAAPASKGALAAPAVTEHGGRVELRLNSRAADNVILYQARWFFSESMVEGSVTILAPQPGESQLTIRIAPDTLPEWLRSFTVTLVRTHGRAALAEGTALQQASWPRRLTRWRNDPERVGSPPKENH